VEPSHRVSRAARILGWLRLASAVVSLFPVAGPGWAAQLTLSWIDNATNEDGFRIERRLSPTGSYAPLSAVAANTVTYPDTTVTDGQSYCYRVQAYNGAGSSGYTNEACATAGPPAPSTYTLTVAKAGTGTGTVAGAGIDCGTDCAETVPSGTTVTLSAAPATGATFTGWTGGGCAGTGTCVVTVSANLTVTATFAPQTYTLTVAKAGTGTGTVSGAGIDCGTDCAETVPSGTTVTLSAVPATGATFTGWTGACGGTGGCSVTVSANTVVGAAFEPDSTTAALEIVIGAGPGSAPRVRGFSRIGVPTDTDFLASDPAFVGGVFVALGALDETGAPAILAGTGAGTPAEVRVFRLDGSPTGLRFFPYGTSFVGGVRLATCDVDGDGRAEIVTAPGPGRTPEVSVWRIDGTTPVRLVRFNAGNKSMTAGLFVACGDLNGDGHAEIVTGTDEGTEPRVRAYAVNGSKVSQQVNFLAYARSFRGGVRVSTGDVDGDGRADILTAPGPNGQPLVHAFRVSGTRVTRLTSFDADDPAFTGGIFVAGGKRDELGGVAVMTAPGAGGGPRVRVFSVSPAMTIESAEFMADDSEMPGGITVGASQ
jgi:hypothetical protein